MERGWGCLWLSPGQRELIPLTLGNVEAPQWVYSDLHIKRWHRSDQPEAAPSCLGVGLGSISYWILASTPALPMPAHVHACPLSPLPWKVYIPPSSSSCTGLTWPAQAYLSSSAKTPEMALYTEDTSRILSEETFEDTSEDTSRLHKRLALSMNQLGLDPRSGA